ncbi:hypothetical protein IWW48_000686 [Coemansia sp. RSA 1200]|nr:hypothetical protein IWW48_000686 [Coemansia sp. RSA 1200]
MPPSCPPSNPQQQRTKSACQLYCRYCHNNVCTRGMRALLLADNRIELFSTDMPPMVFNWWEPTTQRDLVDAKLET